MIEMTKYFKFHKNMFFLSFISFFILFIPCCDKNELFPIVDHSESPYTVIISENASQSEQYAAHELISFIKLATGKELPLVHETDSQSHKTGRIFIGSGTLIDSLLIFCELFDIDVLGDEGFIIRTIKNKDGLPDIIIAGGRLRGTLYGVYTFLEHLGFRWYTERKTVYSESPTLQCQYLNITEKPAFPEREIFIYEATNGDWAARNMINTRSADLEEKHGGKVVKAESVSMDRVIPTSLYKEHPEYFPLIGGERTTGYVQRCLSNPDVIRITAEKVLEKIKNNPHKEVFSIHQNDIENICECPECRKIIEEQDAYSALDIYFVNKVAEIVGEKYPDKIIGTLAYRYAQKPPKTLKPRHNVLIRLCPIEMCLTHPFTECPTQRSREAYEALEGWTNLTDNVKLWHYGTNFSSIPAPLPNFREFPVSLREYKKHRVKGIFYQGMSDYPGSSDAELRSWVLARLLWNPDLDADALVDEWLHGVYGAAYKPMRAYFDLIHDQMSSHHLHIKTTPTKKYWPDSVVASMDRLHNEALALAASDSTALYYVKKSRMSVKYLQFITNTGQLQVVDNTYRPTGSTVTESDFDSFLQYARQFGITSLGENDGGGNLETRLRRRTRSYPVVTIENDDILLDVVPELGGRIVRLVYKKTGTDILNNDPSALHYPNFGGYEETEELAPGHVGFFEPYEYRVNGRTITLSAMTSKGLLFSRTISLPESGSQIQLTSSVTNKNKTMVIVGLECRMHLYADNSGTELTAKTENGSFAQATPTEVFNYIWPFPCVGYRYDGKNKPAGGWRLSNIKDGLTVENSFNADQVKWCRMITEDSIKSARMELHSPTCELPPNGTITIEHVWKIFD